MPMFVWQHCADVTLVSRLISALMHAVVFGNTVITSHSFRGCFQR